MTRPASGATRPSSRIRRRSMYQLARCPEESTKSPWTTAFSLIAVRSSARSSLTVPPVCIRGAGRRCLPSSLVPRSSVQATPRPSCSLGLPFASQVILGDGPSAPVTQSPQTGLTGADGGSAGQLVLALLRPALGHGADEPYRQRLPEHGEQRGRVVLPIWLHRPVSSFRTVTCAFAHPVLPVSACR